MRYAFFAMIDTLPGMENRVKELREAAKLTQTELGEKIGVTWQTISRIENAHTRIMPKHEKTLAEVFEIDPADLYEARELSRLSEDDEWKEDVATFERYEADGVLSDGTPYRPKIPGAIPEVDLEAGAGEGRVGEIFQLALGDDTVSGHRVVAEWLFSADWLRSEVRAAAKRTIVVPVIGDSMRGSYEHGDRVLVDLSQTDFLDGVVFVIAVDGGAPSIKRLAEVYEAKPRRLIVISDNPAVPNREVPASIVKIIGRVVGRVSRQ